MNRTLYEIGADMDALEQMLWEAGGEITDAEMEQIIDDWLDQNREDLENKLDSYAAIIRKREALASARQVEARSIQLLARSDENQVRRMKARLLAFFQFHGIDKVETLRHKFSVSRNGGKRPLILNPDWELEPASAPEQFHKVRIELDTEAIRKAIEDGEEVKDCSLADQGLHLRIR